MAKATGDNDLNCLLNDRARCMELWSHDHLGNLELIEAIENYIILKTRARILNE